MSACRRVIGDHLELRGGSTIYFRRAFPRWTWPHLGGARDFTRSLHTSDLGEAEELRDALVGALDIAWRDARLRVDQLALPPEEWTSDPGAGSAHDIIRHATDAASEYLDDELREREERAEAAAAAARRVRMPGIAPDGGETRALIERLSRVVGGNGSLVGVIEAAVAKALNDQANSSPSVAPVGSTKPLAEAIEEYFTTRELARRSRIKYEQVFREMAERLGPDACVGGITSEFLEQWRAHFVASGKSNEQFRIQRLKIVSGLVRFGVAKRWAGSAERDAVARTMDVVRLATTRKSRKAGTANRRPYSREELALALGPDLADLGERSEPKLRLVRALVPPLAYLTGCRAQELAWLRPQDVRPVDGILALHVETFATEEHPDGETSSKSGERRAVPLHAAVAGLMQRLGKARAGHEFLFDGLWVDKKGGRDEVFRKHYLQRLRRLFGAKSGLTFHGLRSTFARDLQEAEVGREVISALLGHSEATSVTAGYTGRVSMRRMAEAVAKLDAGPLTALLARIEKELGCPTTSTRP